MYKIFILPPASKDLDNLSSKAYTQIKTKISALSDNARPWGSIKLTQDDGYRVRVGDYRILYRIDEKNKRVYVYRIKHRRDAYR